MNYKTEEYIISVVVGYMLKVMKSGQDISENKKEFDAIRHGDYVKFINLVKGQIPFMAEYNEGTITCGYIPPKEGDIDFALLIKAGPSLNLFYCNCISVYGKIEDLDIPDEVYELLALFEINLRIHANNNHLISRDDELIDIINKLGCFIKIPDEEIHKIQMGRKFLNMVKHYKAQFPTGSDGIAALKIAWETLRKYNLIP